ncbi:MAG TPA: NAD(P)-dependent oxidoreductase [Phycisphaerae bacterium]|nr:NAD(P)-dependent oxidoreductase [Phycisphaerae bacterium]
MIVAVTGATGFLGRYVVRHFAAQGHRCRCWFRPQSDRAGFEDVENAIEWVPGTLEAQAGFPAFCRGADAVVHSALYRPGGAGFRAAAGTSFEEFVRVNLQGSLNLMAAARNQKVGRFVFISTCAVHEVILPDRKLDEAHPLWPTTHYGAHKAAIEKFVHSFGLGEGWPICALRPTGIYGLAHPPTGSRWFSIVRSVCRGDAFRSDVGGKEVHAGDVARAVGLLLAAPAGSITGHVFNCYDMYVAEQTVATLAKEISGSKAEISGNSRGPKNQIDTAKLRALGMTFGGEALLRQTVEQLVEVARKQTD